MTARRLFCKVAASATIFSLAVTPDIASACSLYAPIEITSNHMRDDCRRAKASSKKFLEKVKAGGVDDALLRDYVIAFDEGKYGCRKDTGFVHRILDSYYSVPDRLTSAPELLRRYAFSWPKNADPSRRDHIYNLVWLFSDHSAYLPYSLTAEQARAFVSRPEHWAIALGRFGNARDRDDAVFANVSDPASPHFDREAAVRLSEFQSKHKVERQFAAAALLIDRRFGPPDLAKAETLLPMRPLQIDDPGDPIHQRARALWMQIIDGYDASESATQRERGRQLKAIAHPPSLTAWPTILTPKDGKVWLSLNDWPNGVQNPFANAKPERLITANDYPARALRSEEAGTVAVAARFGPGGRFAALEVIQSSGSDTLDAATLSIVQRRFRPKLSNELTLSGYQGKEVRIPLLMVAWLMREGTGTTTGGSSYANGTLTVIAESHRYDGDDFPMCGSPPSIFV